MERNRWPEQPGGRYRLVMRHAPKRVIEGFRVSAKNKLDGNFSAHVWHNSWRIVLK